MNTSSQFPHPRTYLLRLWPVKQDEGIIWLVMLENARQGKPRAFPDLQALAQYLESECQAAQAERAFEIPFDIAPDLLDDTQNQISLDIAPAPSGDGQNLTL